MLLVIDAILFGQRRDLRRRAGQPDNAGLKRACELLQDSGCIALRVQRDEERLYLLASRSELIERFSDRVECRRTRIGAMLLAEIEQHPLAAEVGIGNDATVLIGKLERPSQRWERSRHRRI